MTRHLEQGFLTRTLHNNRHGRHRYVVTPEAQRLAEPDLTLLVFFLLDVFLFIARTPDDEVDEKERRVFDKQLSTATDYPPGLYRDLLWLLGQVRNGLPGEGDWLAELEHAGETLRGAEAGSGTSGGVRLPGSDDLSVLRGAVETGSSQVILMPGGDSVFEPPSFDRAKALLTQVLSPEDYEFFMDTLVVCAVDVITDSWTLGPESITLEDNALLSGLCATFGVDLQGMPERDRRRAREREGR